jgi:hypothetical protein
MEQMPSSLLLNYFFPGLIPGLWFDRFVRQKPVDESVHLMATTHN